MKGVVFFPILEAIICLLLIQFASSSSHSSLNNAESFIVGGRKASEGQFPYIVSLRTIWNTHMCGGSILNSRWILSAAHCTVFLEIPNVVAGSIQINGTGVVYEIEKVINHENYDFEADPFIDDICLLRTSRSIQFNELIQPIPINSNRIFQRGSAVIAGFGWTEGGNHLNPDNFNPVVSNDLNFIEVSVLSHFECTWRLSGWAVFLRLDHICTFGRNNVGVCTFDSGSPVVSNGQLVGVVSFAIPCALGFPDFGPRVSSYTRWINSHIRHL